MAPRALDLVLERPGGEPAAAAHLAFPREYLPALRRLVHAGARLAGESGGQPEPERPPARPASLLARTGDAGMDWGVWYICYGRASESAPDMTMPTRSDGRMSAPDSYQRPALRYKRFGGGYRREDVEFALAELRLTLRQLDNDLAVAARPKPRPRGRAPQRAQRDRELPRRRSTSSRRRWPPCFVAPPRSRRARVPAPARSSRRPRRTAMRIRAEASRRIEDTNAQCNELLRLKDNLLDAMRSVVGDFDQAISRVERGEQLFPGPTQAVPGEGRAARRADRRRGGVPAPVFVAPPVPVPSPNLRKPGPMSSRSPPHPPPPAPRRSRSARKRRSSTRASSSTPGRSPTSPPCRRSSGRSRTCRRWRTSTSAGSPTTAR